MSRFPFLMMLVVVLALSGSVTMPQCSCDINIGIEEAIEAVRYTDVIFSGTVIDVASIEGDTAYRDSHDAFKYHFVIDEIFSGSSEVDGDTMIVTSGYGNGDCGYRFKEGERYIVYGYWHERILWDPLDFVIRKDLGLGTNNCTSTRTYSERGANDTREFIDKYLPELR